MDEEKTLPGEREKKEIDDRFLEIYRCAQFVSPLPERCINNVEIKTYENLIDAFAKFRKKEISKDLFGILARQIKKAHYTEYRSFDFYTKITKEEQKRYMLLSQEVAGLSDILPHLKRWGLPPAKAGSRFSFDSTNVPSISELTPCVPRLCHGLRSY